jgi:hypothetical protein
MATNPHFLACVTDQNRSLQRLMIGDDSFGSDDPSFIEQNRLPPLYVFPLASIKHTGFARSSQCSRNQESCGSVLGSRAICSMLCCFGRGWLCHLTLTSHARSTFKTTVLAKGCYIKPCSDSLSRRNASRSSGGSAGIRTGSYPNAE